MNSIILTAVWGIVMMFGGAFIKSKTTPKYLAIAGLLFILVANCVELISKDSWFDFDVKDMLHFTSFSMVFMTVVLACTLLYFLLNGRDFEKVGSNVSEYFALIFFVLCGVSLVVTFNSLLTLFLGIEIMSIPLYILTGSDKRNLKSNEAALKYFLMGAFSTGLMLLGIAFLYGGSKNGTFFIDDLWTGGPGANLSPLLIAGLLLLLVSIAFKVSAAPFHFWTPDVYDGAPTVFTAFMATVVKVSIFIGFVRLFDEAFGDTQAQWQIF